MTMKFEIFILPWQSEMITHNTPTYIHVSNKDFSI